MNTEELNNLKKAANDGDKEAQYNLGMYYTEQNDFETAAIWIEKAALRRDAQKRAMLGYAIMNDTGMFSKANPEVAIKLYKILIKVFNEPQAMVNLGVMYCESRGTEYNPIEGVELIEKGIQLIEEEYGACDSGYLYMIGMLFYQGKTTIDNIQELEKSIYYLKKAVSAGADDSIKEILSNAEKQLVLRQDIINKKNKLYNNLIDKTKSSVNENEFYILVEGFRNLGEYKKAPLYADECERRYLELKRQREENELKEVNNACVKADSMIKDMNAIKNFINKQEKINEIIDVLENVVKTEKVDKYIFNLNNLKTDISNKIELNLKIAKVLAIISLVFGCISLIPNLYVFPPIAIIFGTLSMKKSMILNSKISIKAVIGTLFGFIGIVYFIYNIFEFIYLYFKYIIN